jgi:hypothetical protein
MSYLSRLKQKIREDGPRSEATKGTKAPSVAFVAPLSAPSRQISPEPAANQPDPIDRQELTWRVAVIHKAQGDSEQVIADCVRDALARPEAALECYRTLWERRAEGGEFRDRYARARAGNEQQGAMHGD